MTFKQIAYYLLTLKRPQGVLFSEFRKFKRHALEFIVKDRLLFKRGTKIKPTPRRVIDDPAARHSLISDAHNESGHRDSLESSPSLP
ncbi:hypothetical protein Ct61P_14509 [Colletotrichum tofieldiae]|nr:hypothetical protein Ct61P_14509 [Colletotrichum tofieldiae]